MIRKVVTLFSLLAYLCVSVGSSTPVIAANSSTCATYGFAVDTSCYEKIGLTNYLTNYVYDSRSKCLIGTSNTIVIFATQKSKVGSKYMNVAMYYTQMTPKSFTTKNNIGISTTYTGKSEYLDISTVLPKAQTYQTSFPENVAGKSEYTLGGSVNFESSGITGGVTASTTITKNRLEITDKSDVDTNTYRVLYDYKSAVLGTDSTNNYLKNRSTQRGSLYYYTDGNSIKFPVTVKASFGYYWGIYWYSDMGSETNKWIINLGA